MYGWTSTATASDEVNVVAPSLPVKLAAVVTDALTFVFWHWYVHVSDTSSFLSPFESPEMRRGAQTLSFAVTFVSGTDPVFMPEYRKVTVPPRGGSETGSAVSVR